VNACYANALGAFSVVLLCTAEHGVYFFCIFMYHTLTLGTLGTEGTDSTVAYAGGTANVSLRLVGFSVLLFTVISVDSRLLRLGASGHLGVTCLGSLGGVLRKRPIGSSWPP
jgi:hypothetical protein